MYSLEGTTCLSFKKKKLKGVLSAYPKSVRNKEGKKVREIGFTFLQFHVKEVHATVVPSCVLSTFW